MARSLTLLGCLLAIAACGDNVTPDDASGVAALRCDGDTRLCEDALADSLGEWLASGADETGQYTYVRSENGPDGYRIRTEIRIESGRVVLRTASGVRPDAATGTLTPFAWEETGADVGRRSEGAPAVPVSTLYEDCLLDVLSLDPAAHDIVLERFDTGALRGCTARIVDCEGSAAACTIGPSIDLIDVATR